ncbi:MAG: Hydrolase, TatD family [Candidatus Jorgensenbacteria bacterium GW2011_GWA1_48_13]|uniref:Hydrolase, TatD family n=1 Tax=Candidatus Jorgensenbacteria bacterium GW2011_GWB1_50_10 TaxID=1618665 RepID=A0A0G1W832_9BACT|nr:MAG: Hydrolase, TatD family [Candidatus Jorgensenbacteria bacterium GW2011_GWA1_48_13]KKW14755.1 MAG: Hydrolase, TatD family [Candidatus Jorgensenbacteria bacterium GW2011_GWB1_50_10]
MSKNSLLRFFDAHTHAQFAAYDSDRPEVLARAHSSGVGMINIGTQKDTSRAALVLAHQYENVYAAVGLHPIHTSKSYHDSQELGGGEAAKGFTSRGEEFDYEYYKNLAEDPKVVAIGECGLDYFRLDGGEEAKKKQKDAFLKQIELAHEVRKPLMIHCRNAFDDLIETVIHNSKFTIPDNPGVIHFFSGTPTDAKKLLELGFYFTFGGVITFVRDYDEVIKIIPLDRILSETDAPYVAPVPYRGKRNEPLYVIEVVKKLAELKKLSFEAIVAQILENAGTVFNLG